jgi:hypothetical protein
VSGDHLLAARRFVYVGSSIPLGRAETCYVASMPDDAGKWLCDPAQRVRGAFRVARCVVELMPKPKNAGQAAVAGITELALGGGLAWMATAYFEGRQ